MLESCKIFFSQLCKFCMIPIDYDTEINSTIIKQWIICQHKKKDSRFLKAFSNSEHVVPLGFFWFTPSHKVTVDYSAPRDTLCWGFSLLPPRFLPLIDPGALPCPSTLLLPTQPPITDPARQQMQNNRIQSESNPTYKSFNMQKRSRVKVVKEVFCRKASLGSNDSSALLVPERSAQSSSNVYVTCSASWWQHASHALSSHIIIKITQALTQ